MVACDILGVLLVRPRSYMGTVLHRHAKNCLPRSFETINITPEDKKCAIQEEQFNGVSKRM